MVFYPGNRQIAVSQQAIIACLLRRCCGLSAQVPLGVICPTILGIGTESMFVTIAGVKKGVWVRIFETMTDDPDLDYLMVDGSIVRVHQHGAAKKTYKPTKPKVDREVS